jgi:hypothetical protein
MVSSGLLRRVALVRADVSQEHEASFIRVTKIIICLLNLTVAPLPPSKIQFSLKENNYSNKNTMNLFSSCHMFTAMNYCAA